MLWILLGMIEKIINLFFLNDSLRVSGHSDFCISRMELEVIFTLRRNIPPLLL